MNQTTVTPKKCLNLLTVILVMVVVINLRFLTGLLVYLLFVLLFVFVLNIT